MAIILVDTETTGVGATDKVCEIAWREIDMDFNIVAQHESLINPGKHIPPGASAVNGITDDMVVEAPTLAEYMASHGAPLSGDNVLFIAHNASFDYRFLKEHLHENTTQLCTLKCSRRLYPSLETHKQGALAYHFGFPMDRSKAHSAGGDLDVLLYLLKQLVADNGGNIHDLLELQTKPIPNQKIGFGKHKGTLLKDLPRDYVHWLLNKTENLDPELRSALAAL